MAEKLTVSAQNAVGKTKFAGPLVRIPAAIIGEKFINAGGLRTLRTVVRKPLSAKNTVDAAHHAAEKALHRPKKVLERVEKLSVGGAGRRAREHERHRRKRYVR